MRRTLMLLILAGALAGLAACASAPRTSLANPAYPADSSANALDWPGTYVGILPCADCPGIETRLTLSADLTYRISTRYLGRKLEPYVAAGRCSWDEEGRTIRLAHYRGGPGRYLVGENQLFHLDEDGKRIGGALADSYRLVREEER